MELQAELGRVREGIDLRDATKRDAAALAALNVASWRAAYAHMLPEAFLATMHVSAREERLRGSADILADVHSHSLTALTAPPCCPCGPRTCAQDAQRSEGEALTITYRGTG
jgi:hypothetical protein